MQKTKILICNYDDVFRIGLKDILAYTAQNAKLGR